LGHFFGLSHPPATEECNQSTMYFTASAGEINKRDLTDDDKQCIIALYEESVPINQSAAAFLHPSLLILSFILSFVF